MADQTGYDVFISYSPADCAWVEGYLLDALTQAGLRCHTEAEFALGRPRIEEVERAVRQSRRTLLVLSPAYQSEPLKHFADLLVSSLGADTATWPVIPLILQPVDLPLRLRMLVGLDATDPNARPSIIERLVAEFQRPLPPPSPPPQCPYPGMAPFAESDSGHFYGREAEVAEMVERLRLSPILAIIGPSGSGKSSLAFAGLIPALRTSRRFGPGEWHVRAMRPGATPLETLRATVGDAVNLETFQRTDEEVSRLLLVVDQFEEVFTHRSPQTDQADAFQSTLARLADLPGCYVILTVRADFFADLLTCPLWQPIKEHRYEVLPLDAAGLRQAIVRPAEDAGVYVEAALVERLIADAAGEPGVLPFMQETLTLLWEHLERRFLPLRAYDALVLPGKAYQGAPRTGLQVAMARRADAALAALSDAQQAIARRIFLRLVQFGEGRADTRRQQAVETLRSDDDDPVVFDRVLTHLAAARLLTLSGDQATSERRVDISHEALIKGWPTLATWIANRREAELMRRRLEEKVAEWIRFGRSQGGLLDAEELIEVDAWLADPAGADLGRDDDLVVLIAASRTALNPGWQRTGALWMVLAAIASAAALAGIGFWLQIIRLPTSGLLTTILFLVVLIVGAIWLFTQLRRADRYFLQRWSHTIARSIPLRIVVGVTAAAVIGLWSLGGWQALRIEATCEQWGYGRQMSAIPIAVVNRNADPAGVEYFARIFNSIQPYYQARVATSEEARLCRRFVEYRVELSSERAEGRAERSYTAVVYRSSDGQQEDVPFTIFGSDSCGYYQVLAYQFTISKGVVNATIDTGTGIPAPDSCQLLLLNEEGYAALKERRWDDAERAFTQAISVYPDFAWAHINLGELYYRTERYPEAIAEMRRANQLAQRPYAPFLRQLAIACYRGRDYPCAMDANQRAMAADPTDWISVNNLALVYRSRGDYSLARQTLEQAAALVADVANTQDRERSERILTKNRGITAFLAGDLNEARSLLLRADQTGWEFEEETVFYLARTSEQTGDMAQACKYWLRHSQLTPSFLYEEAERRKYAAVRLLELNCSP